MRDKLHIPYDQETADRSQADTDIEFGLMLKANQLDMPYTTEEWNDYFDLRILADYYQSRSEARRAERSRNKFSTLHNAAAVAVVGIAASLAADRVSGNQPWTEIAHYANLAYDHLPFK